MRLGGRELFAFFSPSPFLSFLFSTLFPWPILQNAKPTADANADSASPQKSRAPRPPKKKLRKRNFFSTLSFPRGWLLRISQRGGGKRDPLAKFSSFLAKKNLPLYLALKRQERGVKGEERRIAFASGRRGCWMLQKVKEGRAQQEFSLVLEGIFENSCTPHG